MEMTFPHPVSRQATLPEQGHQALLAAVIARQASSPTARAVLLAAKTRTGDSSGDSTRQRIHYFGSLDEDEFVPSGAFFATRRTPDTGEAKDEAGVYQDASRNGKVLGVIGDRTGEQFNQAGMEH